MPRIVQVGSKLIPMVTPTLDVTVESRQSGGKYHIPAPPVIDPPDPDADKPVVLTPVVIPPLVVLAPADNWFDATALNFAFSAIDPVPDTYLERNSWIAVSSLTFTQNSVPAASVDGYGYTNRMMKLQSVDGPNNFSPVSNTDTAWQYVAS